jgi:ElaB/YqjD/DUF883 family membrane-anchored ribosome-binding protein
LVDLEKVACGLRGPAPFQTMASFPAAKGATFAACTSPAEGPTFAGLRSTLRSCGVMREASTDKLMSDLRNVLEDAEALLTATAGQAGERIQQARERAQETVRVARERLAGTQEEVVRRARAAADETDTYVRDNPWQAVGIAAGVAFIIGVLVSRR